MAQHVEERKTTVVSSKEPEVVDSWWKNSKFYLGLPEELQEEKGLYSIVCGVIALAESFGTHRLEVHSILLSKSQQNPDENPVDATIATISGDTTLKTLIFSKVKSFIEVNQSKISLKPEVKGAIAENFIGTPKQPAVLAITMQITGRDLTKFFKKQKQKKRRRIETAPIQTPEVMKIQKRKEQKGRETRAIQAPKIWKETDFFKTYIQGSFQERASFGRLSRLLSILKNETPHSIADDLKEKNKEELENILKKTFTDPENWQRLDGWAKALGIKKKSSNFWAYTALLQRLQTFYTIPEEYETETPLSDHKSSIIEDPVSKKLKRSEFKIDSGKIEEVKTSTPVDPSDTSNFTQWSAFFAPREPGGSDAASTAPKPVTPTAVQDKDKSKVGARDTKKDRHITSAEEGQLSHSI